MNRRLMQVAVGTMVSVLGLGCAAETDSGTTPRPSNQPSEGDTNQGEAASSSATPSPWGRLALMGLEVEHYTSLHRMVGQSNVALVGTVHAAAFTRKFVETDGNETMVDRMLELRVSVDRLLHGRVVDGADEVRIEFGPYPDEEATDALWAPLIGRVSLFVLRRKGAPVNLDPKRPDELARKVYRVVSSQGLLDDTDGETTFPMADVLEPFQKALKGKPFDDTVAAVAAAG